MFPYFFWKHPYGCDRQFLVLWCGFFGNLGFSAPPPVHALGPGPSEGDPTNEAEARETQLLAGKKTRKTYECLLKRGHFKRKKSVFQPLSFREYVRFWERTCLFSLLAWWNVFVLIIFKWQASCFPNKRVSAVSIPSMYGIFTYIW